MFTTTKIGKLLNYGEVRAPKKSNVTLSTWLRSVVHKKLKHQTFLHFSPKI